MHFLTDWISTGDTPHTKYRHRVFYVGRNVRALHEVPTLRQSGLVEYVPISLGDVPQLFENGQIPLDVAMVQVAPPDPDGTCSLGISVDVTKAAALAARTVIAEVNPAMPRTAGDSRIPVDRIASFVPVETPVVEYLHEPAGDVAEQIARYVARLIDDRSTLQVGLGRVPNEMLAHLTNRRDLAIHSDVITEPIVDLVAAGVVTGPVTTSWAMGSRRLYDLVDDDPRFAFHPIEHICDPAVIASRERMVSVTQAFNIDLSGQVSTEGLDGALYGGVSTGPAFHRGALASPGGMAIVCLASRSPAGRSAISIELGPGEPVTIPRADVHWVITEYGTAYLFGRSLAERAVALIDIAHPDDRQELLDAAIEGASSAQSSSCAAGPPIRSLRCAMSGYATVAGYVCARRGRVIRGRCRTSSIDSARRIGRRASSTSSVRSPTRPHNTCAASTTWRRWPSPPWLGPRSANASWPPAATTSVPRRASPRSRTWWIPTGRA